MDDLEFVRRCTSGEKAAWNEFVSRYSRLIYAYIIAVLRLKTVSVSSDTVNDLCQDIFLSLVKDDFRKLRSFQSRNGCSLASWLRQVAVNFTVAYLRRWSPPAVALDDEEGDRGALKDRISDGRPAPDEQLIGQELMAQLVECIEALETSDRFFIGLLLQQGLSLDDLKEFFQVSRGAIDMRKSRLVMRLRDCFRSKGFLNPGEGEAAP